MAKHGDLVRRVGALERTFENAVNVVPGLELPMFLGLSEGDMEQWLQVLAHHAVEEISRNKSLDPADIVLRLTAGMLGVAMGEKVSGQVSDEANKVTHAAYNKMAMNFGWPLLFMNPVRNYAVELSGKVSAEEARP